MHTPARAFVDPRVSTGRRYRILVVDDEPDILEVVSRALRHAFHDVEVLVAEDPVVALTRLHDGAVDLIISDYRMPKMNGLEFLERAKGLAPLAPRIMMTAYPDLDLAVKAINEQDVIRFLVKPIEPAKFLQVIRAALDDIATREARDRLVSDKFGVGRVS